MKKSRWIVASMFAWCLAGSVALAVYSGRPTSRAEAAAPLELVPVDTPPETEVKVDTPQGSPKKPAAAPKPAKAPAKAASKLKAIQWAPSFEAAMKRARAQDKPVMIDFYTDWCHWCKVLDTDVYTDKSVIAESTNWVSVKVNAEKRPDLAQAYGITGFPNIMFVENDGKPFDTIGGYAPMPGFLELMRTAYTKRKQPSQA